MKILLAVAFLYALSVLTSPMLFRMKPYIARMVGIALVQPLFCSDILLKFQLCNRGKLFPFSNSISCWGFCSSWSNYYLNQQREGSLMMKMSAMMLRIFSCNPVFWLIFCTKALVVHTQNSIKPLKFLKKSMHNQEVEPINRNNIKERKCKIVSIREL